MLNHFEKLPDKKTTKEKRSQLGGKLAYLQRKLEKTNSSMLVLVDGWESSGKGFVLKDLTRELDARYYKVSVYENPTDEEEEHNFLWRFVKNLPPKGNIAFFDRSFYYELLNDLEMPTDELDHQLMDVSLLERLLEADGTLVLKLFLDHSEETMKQRITDLEKDPYRSFLISKNDKKQLAHYPAYRKQISNILEKTNFPDSPWHIIPSENLKDASRTALEIAIEELERHLEDETERVFLKEWQPELIEKSQPLLKLDRNRFIDDEEYEEKKESLQRRAGELVYQLWLEEVPCLIAFEGTDAAGKGGAIQRLTRYMDPRGYQVATTAAPTEQENRFHYLWRFYKTFPERGRLTIYDRSWYGRVLVERVEKLTPAYRLQDAYAEINEMEHNLVHEGFLLLKFLIVIDKEEQKKRFEARENDPEKNYKLTDEDWRNHAKFDQYEEAMNEMLEKTSTSEAPWTVIEGGSKKYARIKVLETFIQRTEEFLKQHHRS